jgi:hypothetical protein
MAWWTKEKPLAELSGKTAKGLDQVNIALCTNLVMDRIFMLSESFFNP